MNAMEWLDKQVEIAELRTMYRDFNHKIFTVYGTERKVSIVGARELAAEVGTVVRIGYEDTEHIEEFFEYKGVRFSEMRRKYER